MNLGEKIRYLREVEGSLRGMGREMTQQEMVRAIKKELGESLSQSYLSQIESGDAESGRTPTAGVEAGREKREWRGSQQKCEERRDLMNWELFYLVCFFLGFALSLISFVAGGVHLHLPTKLHFHLGGHGVP